MTTEQKVFRELEALCASGGYIHAIAYLCARDCWIVHNGAVKAEDLSPPSKDWCNRAELSMLIGLMLKNPIDYQLPSKKTLVKYVRCTQALLKKLHSEFIAAGFGQIDFSKTAKASSSPFSNGLALREPIFYGTESAYIFQYLDFSIQKYELDNAWLSDNKGFSIEQAYCVIKAIFELQEQQAKQYAQQQPRVLSGCLTAFTFFIPQVAECANIDQKTVAKIVNCFTVPDGCRNETFNSMQDFNIADACPVIKTPNGSYLMFQGYSLAQALYASPIFWMRRDEKYQETANKNRGSFTESFAKERLTKVFGAEQVFANVKIYQKGATSVAGEVDVLVLYEDLVLVVQAKSKCMTIKAQQGGDKEINGDFKKAIQDSSNQAHECAKLIKTGNCEFKDCTDQELKMPRNIKKIYKICLLSEHYPALNQQVQALLKYEEVQAIAAPLVVNVFTLDSMTERLSSPLLFLDYMDRRTSLMKKLIACDESSILGYHLKCNLPIYFEHEVILIDQSYSLELDAARCNDALAVNNASPQA